MAQKQGDAPPPYNHGGQYNQQPNYGQPAPYNPQQQPYNPQQQPYNPQQQPYYAPPAAQPQQTVIMAAAPPVTNSVTNTVVVGGSTVVGTGNCPHCRIGNIREECSILAIILAIIFFPIGLLFLLCMRDRKCSHCNYSF